MSVSELLEQREIQVALSSVDNTWSKLAPDLQRKFVNERNWKRAVIKWSLHNQLRWLGSFTLVVALFSNLASLEKENEPYSFCGV